MRELIGSLHRLERARGGNAYLIEEAGRSVLVDTGLPSSGKAVVAELAAARLPAVTDIVVTHYDPDHLGGAAEVQRATGARVWLGAADARILRGDALPPTRLRRWMLSSGWLGRAELPELSELPDGAEAEVAPGVVAVPAPGHTPGHHIVRWRGVALIGDAALVREGRLVPFPSALISEPERAEATVAAIAEARPRLVCPGHGAPDRLG